jgi:hypothetical protein
MDVVVWVVMSTILAVWSPEAVAKKASSSENTISMMALVWTRKARYTSLKTWSKSAQRLFSFMPCERSGVRNIQNLDPWLTPEAALGLLRLLLPLDYLLYRVITYLDPNSVDMSTYCCILLCKKVWYEMDLLYLHKDACHPLWNRMMQYGPANLFRISEV